MAAMMSFHKKSLQLSHFKSDQAKTQPDCSSSKYETTDGVGLFDTTSYVCLKWWPWGPPLMQSPPSVWSHWLTVFAAVYR